MGAMGVVFISIKAWAVLRVAWAFGDKNIMAQALRHTDFFCGLRQTDFHRHSFNGSCTFVQSRSLGLLAHHACNCFLEVMFVKGLGQMRIKTGIQAGANIFWAHIASHGQQRQVATVFKA